MGNTLHPHHLNDPRILAEVLQEEILAAAFEDEEISDNHTTNRSNKPKISSRRAAPRHRNRCYAIDEMSSMTDKEFTRYFRLKS